jgi:enoyl-CoA hydratase
MSGILIRELSDGILTFTLNRPEARNALDLVVVEALHAALGEAERESSVGLLILTGAPQPGQPPEKQVFISGADIKQLRERTLEDAFKAINSALFRRIADFPKVTIAAMAGSALGGGLELALASDLRVASLTGRYGLPETALGIIPGYGGTQRLPRLIGLGRAKEIILTGKTVDGAEAERIGLVTQAVACEAVLETARALARKVLARGPLAIRLAKRAIDLSANLPLEDGAFLEILAQGATFGSNDKVEGMTAFLEKRTPRFNGS